MLQTELTGEPIVILEADPLEARLLRQSHPDIAPGYHMNRRHWITLHPGGDLDRHMVEDLVTDSYLLVVGNLPRADRPVDPDTFRSGARLISGDALQERACSLARSLAEVDEGYPFTDSLLVFKVTRHVFLIVTEDDSDPGITVKADPPDSDVLIQANGSITPGRYLDRHHWISVRPGPDTTETLVDELVRESYDIVVDGLPAAARYRLSTDSGNTTVDGGR